MSFWYEPKKEDIDFSKDGKEMHIWLGDDEQGNIYASIEVKVLREILSTHNREL